MHNGPEVYGVLLGMIGVGSILGSFALNRLKALLGPDRLATLGTLGTILALGLYGEAREPFIAAVASLIAGASWITMMTTLFVSAQVALPEWVRGRGLAIFLTAFFGAMTLGSAVWGKVASLEGVPTALYLAAAGAAVGMALTARWRLQTAAALDLTPSMHWRTPVFVHPVEDDQGPILVTVEYRIDPKDIRPFLALMHEIGLERKRDGAYAWGVFEDTQVSGRIVETFLIQSMLELRHLRTRVTIADRMIEEQAGAFLKEPRKVTFLVAPKRHRHKRRKGSKRLAPPEAAREPRPGRLERRGTELGRSIGCNRAWPRGALRFGDRLRHQAKNLVLGRDAAEALKRADASERLVQIGAGGRARPEIIAAPHDRLAPQVHEARALHCVADPIAIAGKEELPELLGLDRIADVRIERMAIEAMLGQDRRQQEWADRAPSLVDVDCRLGGRNEFGQRRVRRRKPQHRIVDKARSDSVGLAAEHEAVVPEGGLAQAQHVGIDPAATRLLDHPVAKHVGEGRDRRLAVGDEPAGKRLVGADRPRVGEAHAGRQFEARIVAEEAQARAGFRKGGETRVGERIEGPMPEGAEF